MASTSGSYQSTMSSEHESEAVASATYQHADADNEYDFKTNKSDDWVDGEEGGDVPLKPQTPTIDDRATTQTTIPITMNPHAVTKSILMKRRFEDETKDEFHSFIHASIVATRIGDYEEVLRLSQLRRRKRSRRILYAWCRATQPVHETATNESESLNNNFNEQQPQQPQQKSLPLLPEVVTSVVYHADTDDEDFKTSSQSAVMDYDADTDCEDLNAAAVDEDINKCRPNSQEAESANTGRSVRSRKRKQSSLEEDDHSPETAAGNRSNGKNNYSADGCTNQAKTEHGAKPLLLPKKLCSKEGCTNQVINGGVCCRHGAKVKRCRSEGCTNQAQKGGVCIRHGLERKL